MIRALWRWVVAFLAYHFPSDEQLYADTPELRQFLNRQEILRASRRHETHG